MATDIRGARSAVKGPLCGADRRAGAARAESRRPLTGEAPGGAIAEEDRSGSS